MTWPIRLEPCHDGARTGSAASLREQEKWRPRRGGEAGGGGLLGVNALLVAAADGEEGVEMGGAAEVEKTVWFAYVDDDSGVVLLLTL